MILEAKVLSAVYQSHEAYTEVSKLISKDEFTDPAKIIYTYAETFYNNDKGANSVDKEIVSNYIERDYPKAAKVLQQTLNSLEEVSIPNILSVVLDFKKQAVGLKLSSALINNKEKEITSLMEEYALLSEIKEEENDDSEIYNNIPIDSIISKHSSERLYKLYPKSLNDAVDGGAMPGHHILVFARPESGKSLFSINMSCGFLRQNKRVLYVGNEDPAEQMLMRFICRLSEMNKDDVKHNPREAERLSYSRGYENLVFAALAPGTLSEIDGLIEEYKPEVLVVDQLRNLNVGDDNRVLQLERAAIGIRNIAKKRKLLAVSVTQAGDSADRKLVLDMGDVDFSNTGIPAAVDLMIGIGMNDDYDAKSQRMLSLCKNKLSGIHSYFPVAVDTTISKVISL